MILTPHIEALRSMIITDLCIFPGCKFHVVHEGFCLHHAKYFAENELIKPKKRLIKKKIPLTHAKLLAKAQKVFNCWIRNRDKEKQCITCPKYQIEHACHFYAAGQYTVLRFNEDNCHGGCLQCNYFKHGNLNHYRMNLERRIGAQRLALLDSVATRNRTKKWSRLELELIISMYTIKET